MKEPQPTQAFAAKSSSFCFLGLPSVIFARCFIPCPEDQSFTNASLHHRNSVHKSLCWKHYRISCIQWNLSNHLSCRLRRLHLDLEVATSVVALWRQHDHYCHMSGIFWIVTLCEGILMPSLEVLFRTINSILNIFVFTYQLASAICLDDRPFSLAHKTYHIFKPMLQPAALGLRTKPAHLGVSIIVTCLAFVIRFPATFVFHLCCSGALPL